MRLTFFTEYGMRVLMRMASEPERAFSTAVLAAELRLSRNHLAKIVPELVRGGLLRTRRGAGGGAILARPPEEIRLGDVVALLEEGRALVECFSQGGGVCAFGDRCALKGRLRQAGRAFLNELNRSTLADVALSETRVA